MSGAASRPRVVGWVLVLLGGAASSAWSDAALAQNYRSVPIGGRTATMGGAGTAVGDDSAMPYLNPSGMAGIPGDVVAISASVYAWTSRTIDRLMAPNGYDPALGPIDGDQTSFSSSSLAEFPSSVMYFKHLSPPEAPTRHFLGVSLVIPSATAIDLVASRTTRFSNTSTTFAWDMSLIERRTDYYVGPTYALAVGDRLHLGASLFGLYSKATRARQSSLSALIANGTYPGQGKLERSEESSALGIVPIGGAQLNVASKLWVGIGVAAPSLHLRGSSSINFASTNVGISPPNTLQFDGDSFSADADHESSRPLRLNAGVAWEDRDAFSFAADVHLYWERANAVVTDGPQRNVAIRTGQAARAYESTYHRAEDWQRVVDVSVGAEAALGSLFAIRAGFFTDMSPLPEFTDPTPELGFRLRENRLGGSLGLGTRIGSFDSTVGALYARSTGQFVTVDLSGANLANPATAVDTMAHTWMLVLSGAVTTDEAEDTMSKSLPGSGTVPGLPR